MTNTAKALYNFFSGFGLPAYVEYNVPDSAVLPYITYQVVEPDWMDAATIYARVWYRDTSYIAINAKADQIKAAIGGGAMLPTDGGFIVLEKRHAVRARAAYGGRRYAQSVLSQFHHLCLYDLTEG